jgi:hypothetical protein
MDTDHGRLRMYFVLIYLIASILVGLLGTNRKFGFWGHFFGSVLLSPMVGIILVLASDNRKSYPR